MQKLLPSILLIPLLLCFLAFRNDDMVASKARGAEIYMEYCMSCHMAEGEGVSGVFPPLDQSDYLLADIERAIGIVKNGQSGLITVNEETYNSFMPSPGLDDDEIADVLNFVLNSWGNEYGKMITGQQVAELD